METMATQSFPLSLHGVPFDQKWELLKSTIERLYIHENLKLPDVIKSIRDQYGFDANEPQYKYQIKKWKFKKSFSAPKKKAICQVLQKRAEVGKSSAIIRGGQDVDTKNLRRYLKTERRRAIALQPGAVPSNTDICTIYGRITQCGNRIFMNWNMPYGAVGSPAARAADHVSPLSDIIVTTPQSPREAPSPMTVAVREMNAIERSRLLVQGKQMDLLKSLETPQRITLSTWMYQYWLFAFKTAKHWGRGPQDWTASILGFDDHPQRATVLISSPKTPAANTITPASKPTPRNNEFFDPTFMNAEDMPSALCRWSIHYLDLDFDPIPSPPRSPTGNFNLDEEKNWPRWPRSTNLGGYTEKLSENLESNDFSSVKVGDLPIAVDHIARAARGSPAELLEEALGFSIMSRNADLMMGILMKIEDGNEIAGLYPFHLAATYLDGSKTCCDVFDVLLHSIPRSLRKLYVNELGHTILDQLMITILKAHTSCLPNVVDVIFKRESRFEGEDVDICGRWDADSACVRSLLANDTSRLPFEWKHMFCHTSVQTICHCIGTVFGPRWGPDINTPSGIFLRRCSHCGLKLQLLPLHTLILVGLHLSHSGCKGENLFGILACLLCLLSNGANPLLKAHISSQALFENDQGSACGHEELDPAELIEKLSTRLELRWSKELSTGWQVIHYALKQSQAEWKLNHLPAYCPDHDALHNFLHNFYGANKVLAPLWAAVQTELLTYRRSKEGGEWLSQNFNMRSLHEGLIGKGKVDIALVQNEMMKSFGDCGDFLLAAGRIRQEPPAPYYFAILEPDAQLRPDSKDSVRGRNMDLKPVPKLDFSTIPQEDLSDFISLPWYQTLLQDPTFTPIGNRDRRATESDTKRRTFFSNTLWTDTTIRSTQCFYKGFIHPERWTGDPRPAPARAGPGECRQIFSLGQGLGGGTSSFAHGGLIATILDETLGTPLFVQSTGCATAELTVQYERPVPIPGVVLCRSWVEKTEGRKVWIDGVLEDGNGLVYARGRSLFVRFRERL